MARVEFLVVMLLLGLPSLLGASGVLAEPASESVFEQRLVVAVAGASDPLPDRETECEARAPWVPVCTTGPHVRDGDVMGLGLWAVNYVGTVEARLDWEGEPFVIRCDIQRANGTCTVSGDWIPPGEVVVHNCRSYELGTSEFGGHGLYGCAFLEEAVTPAP